MVKKNAFIRWVILGFSLVIVIWFHQALLAQSNSSLLVVYPPNNHRTTAEKIFLIGSASTKGQVFINNQLIKRSKLGYFAPSLPLKIGENPFTIRYQDKTVTLKVTRNDINPTIPKKLGFADQSFSPSTNITRLVGEWVCFSAIATPKASVSVILNNETIKLLPQAQVSKIPANSAVLTNLNQSKSIKNTGLYRGCKQFNQVANLGNPSFKIELNNQSITQKVSGAINIISDENLPVIEVIVDQGVMRTGASSDHSRLTPLPKGTKVRVTGKEGDWLRLDYGAWILAKETRFIENEVLDTAIIRGISSRSIEDATELIFPLSHSVPINIRQEDNQFILTLYNTVAQTDTIYLTDNPLVRRMDWRQVNPTTVEYTFFLSENQQWGYDFRYEESNLILTLRYPPKLTNQKDQPLKNTKILLDPGHGGKETGAVGPTGYTEKEINLVVSKLIKQELEQLGATVYMTRETDIDLSLPARVEMINNIQPTLSLSIHYNALPDDGDALTTDGIGVFWYHTQAHNLSVFLHNYLTKTLNRPSYGVFWNNLALTRPYNTPSLLLELGFMSNPDEFEWINNTKEQKKLAKAVADGFVKWFCLFDFETRKY